MKTTIKSLLLTTLGVAGIFTAMLYQSCTQEKCQSIVCAYAQQVMKVTNAKR